MDVACTYNIVIGRPLLNSLRATHYTFDLEMHYLAENGYVGKIVASQKITKKYKIFTMKATLLFS